jgi:Xaa-Pro dipeptidase
MAPKGDLHMLELPRFSLAERNGRWKAVRKSMSEAGLDCLVIWGESGKWDSQMANIRYLTQIGGNGEEGVLLFPREGDPTIYLWSTIMEPFWRKAQDWVEDIRERDRVRNQNWISCIRTRLGEMGLLKGRIGLLTGSLKDKAIMPHEIHAGLMNELGETHASDATHILEKARLIKSPEEIAFLERAGEIGDKMTEALRYAALPGVKECEVFAEVVREMVRNGGELPNLFLWSCGSGPGTSGPFAHPGRFATTRTIQAGDVIIMEMHSRYGGYVTHQERTVFVGEPRRLYRDLYEAGLSAFKKSVEKLTPQLNPAEAVRTLRDGIRESGFSFREAGIHGHGLESGEDPYVGGIPFSPSDCFLPFPIPAAKFLPGMTFALNIDTTTTDWSTGTMLAETFLITDERPRQLTTYNLDPIVTG